jgi:hypothetical protein
MNALNFKILFSALILKFLLFVQLFGQTGWNNNDVLVEDGAISECGNSILSITSISMKLMDGTSIASLPLQQPLTAAADSTLVYFPSDISINWSSFAGQGFYIEIIESDMDNGDLCTHEFRDDTWIFPYYSPPTPPTPSLPNFSSTSQAYYSTCCHTNQSNNPELINPQTIEPFHYKFDNNLNDSKNIHQQLYQNGFVGYQRALRGGAALILDQTVGSSDNYLSNLPKLDFNNSFSLRYWTKNESTYGEEAYLFYGRVGRENLFEHYLRPNWGTNGQVQFRIRSHADDETDVIDFLIDYDQFDFNKWKLHTFTFENNNDIITVNYYLNDNLLQTDSFEKLDFSNIQGYIGHHVWADTGSSSRMSFLIDELELIDGVLSQNDITSYFEETISYDNDLDGLSDLEELNIFLTDPDSQDTDNDSYLDANDAFPLDASEWLDTDGDTIGNNADTDDDNDSYLDANDAFPLDASEWLDTDGDTIGNNSDTDDDNDGYLDANDAFPLDASEWLDTDGDTIGNNADTDDDNDGYLDGNDAFPLDASEWLDTDGDTIGNNADTDDDNDTILDYKEIEIGSDPLSVDTLQSLISIIDDLFSLDDVKDLRPGSTMIEVSENQATVQLQMEESSDLQSWEDTGTPATMIIPADTDTKFFRFKMAE